MNARLFGLAALVPAMCGPAAHAEVRGVIAARWCGGGSVTVPLPGHRPDRPLGCDFKACHANCNRKRPD